jgi:dTDP-4-amino-4,6-dideoxygalactose transaminase
VNVISDAAAVRQKFLPFALPSIGEEEIAEVVDCLRSGWITTGPKVKRFETEFAKWIGAQHAIAVNSCTAGLHISLAALGVRPGDEVIVPSLTFCATANVVVHLGATPVLVDTNANFNIDPGAITAAITPRTRAIIPVHYSGQSCDLAEIYAIAKEHGLAVVEDAAHAVGTTYRDRKIGSDAILNGNSIRRTAVFSFYATKNMTTGEGGMITTNDSALAEQMRLLTLHGMSRDAWKRYSATGSWFYDVVAAGYKYNMTDIQAALGIHQLTKLPSFISTRQQYAQQYDAGLSGLDAIRLPRTYSDRNHTYHLYVIRLVLDKLNIGRAEFIQELTKSNIGSSVHFIPVHLHQFYQSRFGCRPGQLPETEAAYNEMISLPLYPAMTQEDVMDVIRTVRHLVEKNRKVAI